MSDKIKREHCRAWDDFAVRCEVTPEEIKRKILKVAKTTRRVAKQVRRLRNIRRKL